MTFLYYIQKFYCSWFINLEQKKLRNESEGPVIFNGKDTTWKLEFTRVITHIFMCLYVYIHSIYTVCIYSIYTVHTIYTILYILSKFSWWLNFDPVPVGVPVVCDTEDLVL